MDRRVELRNAVLGYIVIGPAVVRTVAKCSVPRDIASPLGGCDSVIVRVNKPVDGISTNP